MKYDVPIKLGLLVALTATLAFQGFGSPRLAETSAQKGLFGQVVSIANPDPGLTILDLYSIDLEYVNIEVVETTIIQNPGHETASVENIVIGDSLAILASQVDGNVRASQILIKQHKPMIYSHVVGSLIGKSDGRLIMMDKEGHIINADTELPSNVITAGQIATAITKIDPETDNLTITALEMASTKVTRLSDAINQAILQEASQNQSHLEERIQDNIAGYLTALLQIGNQVDTSLEFVFSSMLEKTTQTNAELLNTFGLPDPSLISHGIIQDIDLSNNSISVSPEYGASHELIITNDTEIRRFGLLASPGNLEAGQNIQFKYQPISGELLAVDVLFPSTPDNLIQALLPSVLTGELDGTISQPPAPHLTAIRLQDGRMVVLSTDSDTKVRQEGNYVALSDISLGTPVKVNFDVSTMYANQIEAYDNKPGVEFVSGVVKSFIPKIRPGIIIPGNDQEGNLELALVNGSILTLSVGDNTIIERSGLRMNIFAISIGDIVRPTSTYKLSDGEVIKLSVSSPKLVGTITGKGRESITVMGNGSVLVKLTLGPDTEIYRDGNQAKWEELLVGDKIRNAIYNPLTLEASYVSVGAPKTIRISGTIISVDKSKGILTVKPTTGEPQMLLIPNKPGIITIDNVSSSLEDLDISQEVDVAFYRPNGVVVEINLLSRN